MQEGAFWISQRQPLARGWAAKLQGLNNATSPSTSTAQEDAARRWRKEGQEKTHEFEALRAVKNNRSHSSAAGLAQRSGNQGLVFSEGAMQKSRSLLQRFLDAESANPVWRGGRRGAEESLCPLPQTVDVLSLTTLQTTKHGARIVFLLAGEGGDWAIRTERTGCASQTREASLQATRSSLSFGSQAQPRSEGGVSLEALERGLHRNRDGKGLRQSVYVTLAKRSPARSQKGLLGFKVIGEERQAMVF